MRHLKKGRKFHRKRGQRRAFFKNLMASLILHGKIKTTEAKAKEIRPRLEKLITLGKKQNLASLRILLSKLPKAAANKIYYEIAPQYKDHSGGYVRIIKSTKRRKNDAAPMATIEFVEGVDKTNS